MKKLITILFVSILALTGCASQDYALYAKAQSDVDIARHNAEAEKYKAMASIAAQGDPSAKVAAVMAMALGQGGAQAAHTMQAPQASTALQWAQVLVPGLTQIATTSANMRLGMVQSDNAAKVATSTNDAFVGIAGKIQAPAANITTTTTDSHNTDNHTVTPAPVTPVVIAPSTKICTINPATNTVVCQ